MMVAMFIVALKRAGEGRGWWRHRERM